MTFSAVCAQGGSAWEVRTGFVGSLTLRVPYTSLTDPCLLTLDELWLSLGPKAPPSRAGSAGAAQVGSLPLDAGPDRQPPAGQPACALHEQWLSLGPKAPLSRAGSPPPPPQTPPKEGSLLLDAEHDSTPSAGLPACTWDELWLSLGLNAPLSRAGSARAVQLSTSLHAASPDRQLLTRPLAGRMRSGGPVVPGLRRKLRVQGGDPNSPTAADTQGIVGCRGRG